MRIRWIERPPHPKKEEPDAVEVESDGWDKQPSESKAACHVSSEPIYLPTTFPSIPFDKMWDFRVSDPAGPGKAYELPQNESQRVRDLFEYFDGCEVHAFAEQESLSAAQARKTMFQKATPVVKAAYRRLVHGDDVILNESNIDPFCDPNVQKSLEVIQTANWKKMSKAVFLASRNIGFP